MKIHFKHISFCCQEQEAEGIFGNKIMIGYFWLECNDKEFLFYIVYDNNSMNENYIITYTMQNQIAHPDFSDINNFFNYFVPSHEDRREILLFIKKTIDNFIFT